MGIVYLARDVRLGCAGVAIYVLSPRRRRRWTRRTSCAKPAPLPTGSHDNIVVIHEVDEHAGVPYMVLEHL